MENKKKREVRRLLVFLLAATLMLTSWTGWQPEAVYAADGAGSVNVSVRIEDETETFLPYTELNVGRFDLKPFISGDSDSFDEPGQILSAHALIEAVYYQNYGSDPAIEDLTSPGGLTAEVTEAIAQDLSLSYSPSWGLGIGNINGNYNLCMSAINDDINVGGIGSDELSTGDNIVFFPWGDSSYNSLSYSYFEGDCFDYDAESGTLTVRLYMTGYDYSYNYFCEPASGAAVTAVGDSATAAAITDSEGYAELALADGDYILTSGDDTDFLVAPYASISINGGGCAVTFPYQDVEVEELRLSGTNVLPYLETGSLYRVTNDIQSVSISAISVPAGSDYAIEFTDPDGILALVDAYNDILLPEGVSSFEIIVTNGLGQEKAYQLSLRRNTADEDKDGTIDAVLSAIAAQSELSGNSDWVAALCAFGENLSASQTEDYLSKVLYDSRKDTISVSDISKDIIALAGLGIDPRAVPDAYGNPVDLVAMVSDYSTDIGPYGIYTAPYMLLALDSNDYDILPDANWTSEKLVAYILSQQDPVSGAWGGMFATAGDTASVLLSLAPYQEDEEVSSARAKALAFISANQGLDGTFGGANYSAYTVLMASMLGSDPDEDPLFTTGAGISAYDGLLSFRITSGSNENMFAYLGNESYNAMATVDAFRALVSYRLLLDGENSNIYNLGKELSILDGDEWPDSANPLTGIRIVASPSKTTYVDGDLISLEGMTVEAVYADGSAEQVVEGDGTTGYKLDLAWYESMDTPLSAGIYTKTISYLGKTATFIIEVKAQADAPSALKEISLSVRSSDSYLIRNEDVEIINGETTALDVLKTALGRRGISYSIQSGAYITNIDGLGEFDEGANSGWMYSINGTTPSTTSASDYELHDGDEVLWYYTLDYTKDLSSSAWSGEAESESAFEAEIDSSGKATVTLSEKIQSALIEDGIDALKISSDLATIIFGMDAMNTIFNQTTGDIVITALKVDPEDIDESIKAVIGDRPVYDFNVICNKKLISGFDGAVTVRIPYNPAADEDLNELVVYHINDEGGLEIIRNCKFDEKTGEIAFITDHFSQYAIGYRSVPFNDINGHWAESNIKYLAARDIIRGKADGAFKPNDSITRAEFVTILGNKLGADYNEYSQSQFSDVGESAWFAGAVSWAAANGIVNGYDGTFRPNDKISRQEMAAILERYMKRFEKTISLNSDGSALFADDAEIAGYAKDAVYSMRQMGIISGRDSGVFAPEDRATRAEASKMITVLIQKSI